MRWEFVGSYQGPVRGVGARGTPRPGEPQPRTARAVVWGGVRGRVQGLGLHWDIGEKHWKVSDKSAKHLGAEKLVAGGMVTNPAV